MGMVVDTHRSDIRKNFTGTCPGRHRTEQTEQIEMTISPHSQSLTFDNLVHSRFENVLSGIDLL